MNHMNEESYSNEIEIHYEESMGKWQNEKEFDEKQNHYWLKMDMQENFSNKLCFE